MPSISLQWWHKNLLPFIFFINQSTHGNSLCGTTLGSPHQHKILQNYHLRFTTGITMLLYLELERWIVTAWQIDMQEQTPNSNTISLPFFFLQIVPTFATGSGLKTLRKYSCCTVVTSLLLLSGPQFWRFWRTNAFCTWIAAKPRLQALALTARELQSPCRSPNSATMLYGTEDSWSPVLLKLFV